MGVTIFTLKRHCEAYLKFLCYINAKNYGQTAIELGIEVILHLVLISLLYGEEEEENSLKFLACLDQHKLKNSLPPILPWLDVLESLGDGGRGCKKGFYYKLKYNYDSCGSQ